VKLVEKPLLAVEPIDRLSPLVSIIPSLLALESRIISFIFSKIEKRKEKRKENFKKLFDS